MEIEELYKKHLKNIYGFYMAKTFNKQLSEDLTSEVFLTAIGQFNLEGSQSRITDREKYLYGIAKMVWLKYLRSKYSNIENSVENVEDFEKYAVTTINDTKSKSIIDRALPYIYQVPEKQQIILLLRFRDGLSLKEICEQTGKDMNYVKTTQRRGLSSLKELIQGESL